MSVVLLGVENKSICADRESNEESSHFSHEYIEISRHLPCFPSKVNLQQNKEFTKPSHDPVVDDTCEDHIFLKLLEERRSKLDYPIPCGIHELSTYHENSYAHCETLEELYKKHAAPRPLSSSVISEISDISSEEGSLQSSVSSPHVIQVNRNKVFNFGTTLPTHPEIDTPPNSPIKTSDIKGRKRFKLKSLIPKFLRRRSMSEDATKMKETPQFKRSIPRRYTM